MSNEDIDMEGEFFVERPVQTFDDFWKLEAELEASSHKRKTLVSYMLDWY